MSEHTLARISRIQNKVIFAPLGPIARYHLRYTIALSGVPLLCGMILMLLMGVFAKLNLYFLESNGLMIDEQVRDAYFSQVQIELMSMVGYVALQLVVTAIVSIVVMRWASAPFTNALRTVETAVNRPDSLRPQSGYLSESPFFDRVIWLFSLRVKSGGENQVKNIGPGGYLTNFLFLVKFCVTFGILSLMMAYMTSITLDMVYSRVVGLAIDLVRNAHVHQAQHYFLAQEEVLRNATVGMGCISMIIYTFIGWQISQQTANMVGVFARALEEDRFPIQLRTTDIYQNLATALNRAREKIR